jgi:quinohemoprotein ethanol dehydrogenase
MALNPRSNFVYIPVMEMGMTVREGNPDPTQWQPSMDRSFDTTLSYSMGDGRGHLLAWNFETQKPMWDVPQASFVEGGILATAGGLVFQGSIDGSFNAYAELTGKHLWSFKQDSPVIAPPITYSAEGRQYVTVLSGISSSLGMFGPQLAKFRIDPRTQGRRVLTFALGGTASLPPNAATALYPADPDFSPDEARARSGADVYNNHCASCHGISAIAAGQPPDLRRSSVTVTPEAFDRVVRGCALESQGMPCFPEFNEVQLSSLRQYLRTEMDLARRHLGYPQGF